MADRRPAAEQQRSARQEPAGQQSPARVLAGGVANSGRVIRFGQTVRRPVAPCQPATHGVLRHLAAVGYAGSPRLLAADAEHETLSWIPGQAAASPLPDWASADSTLVSVAELVRGFHQASADFDPSGYRWPTPVPERYRGARISHNDLHPGNIIFAGDRAVGLIDFDLAGPGSPIWDLATLLRCWAPLVADVDLPAPLADRPDCRFDRAALLLDGYGLAGSQRAAVVDALLANHDWTYRIVTDAVEAGHPGFGSYWAAVADQTRRARTWLVEQQARLRSAIG